MQTTYHRSNVLFMALTSGLNVGGMMMWAPVLSLILRDLGATDIIIGAANAAWLVVSASGQYLGGRLADRFGRVPVIAWPGVLAAASIVACAAAPSWQLFVVLYAFYHAGGAIQGPVFTSIVGESVPAAERGRAFGRIEVAIGSGVVVGPLLGSFLLPALDVRGVLALSGAFFLTAAALRLIFLKETKPAATAGAPFAMRQILRPPLVRVLGVSFSINTLLSLTLWGPFLSLHANDVMGLSKSSINQLAAVGSAVGIGVALIAGSVVAKRGTVRVLRLAMPLLALAAILWSAQRSTPAIVLSFVLMYAVFEFALISSDTYRVQAVPDEIRGRALGTIGMANNVISAPVIPLASMLRGTVGSAGPFFLALAPAILGLVALHGQAHERAAPSVVREAAAAE
jgi:DHA1 family bicyclomycin/chloramphenicol resistance-like MFS transporter